MMQLRLLRSSMPNEPGTRVDAKRVPRLIGWRCFSQLAGTRLGCGGLRLAWQGLVAWWAARGGASGFSQLAGTRRDGGSGVKGSRSCKGHRPLLAKRVLGQTWRGGFSQLAGTRRAVVGRFWLVMRGAAPAEVEVSAFRLRGSTVPFKFAESLTTRNEGGYPRLRLSGGGQRRHAMPSLGFAAVEVLVGPGGFVARTK